MVGKSRSGLANDRRAYGCNRNCPIISCPSLTNVSLAAIATLGVEGWLLQNNITLLLCDVLEIPDDQTLLLNGFTLTNNGTINVRGVLRNAGRAGITSSSITINNGTINVFSTGSIPVSIAAFGAVARFTNNGIINNNGDIFCQTSGVINNTSGGRINNNSSYASGIGGFRLNALGTFNNSGVFINNGTITLTRDFNPLFFGIIYNNNGGTITNNGIINNAGTINNADGSSTCGVGTITGSAIINTGTIGTACPP